MERYINNITCHTPFQSPGTKSVQKKDAGWSLERRLAAGVLAEMVENFKGCSIQSDKQVDEISDCKKGVEDRNDSFEEVDVLNDSETFVVDGSDPKSDPSVGTHTTDVVSATDTTNGISTQKLYPLFVKAAIQAVETRSKASCGSPSFAVTSVSPTRIGNQDIFSPSNSSTARRGSKADPFDASIGLSTVHISDKLKSVIIPATRVRGLTDSFDGLTSRHGISKVTADRVSEAKAYSDYIKNSEFETMKVFEIQNDSGTRQNQMTQPDQDIS